MPITSLSKITLGTAASSRDTGITGTGSWGQPGAWSGSGEVLVSATGTWGQPGAWSGSGTVANASAASFVEGSFASNKNDVNTDGITITYQPNSYGAQADDYLVIAVVSDGTPTTWAHTEGLCTLYSLAGPTYDYFGGEFRLWYRKLSSGDLATNQTYSFTFGELQMSAVGAWLLRGVHATTPTGTTGDDFNSAQRQFCGPASASMSLDSIAISVYGLDNPSNHDTTVTLNGFTEIGSVDSTEGQAQYAHFAYKQVTAAGSVSGPSFECSADAGDSSYDEHGCALYEFKSV